MMILLLLFHLIKINILICTPQTLEYLTKEECDHILIFSEMVNINNDLEKIKEKKEEKVQE